MNDPPPSLLTMLRAVAAWVAAVYPENEGATVQIMLPTGQLAEIPVPAGLRANGASADPTKT